MPSCNRRCRPVTDRDPGRSGPRPVRAGSGPPRRPRSSGATRGQVTHPRDVARVDDGGPGEHRPAAADGVQVPRVQRDPPARQVALLVLLLVDGEGDGAVPDAGYDVLVEVEGAPLRPRAG